MPELPIINVNIPKPENLVWGENYSSKKDKTKLYKILAYIAIIAALIIFFRFAFLAYLYISNLPKINDYDAKIESIALSDDGKTAYIKLSGGNQKDIDSIKFIFKSNESEYIYETKDGINEISYETKNSFLSYFAHPEYKGSFDYSINAKDIGLENFNNIITVEVSIKYKDESGNIQETKTIDSSKKEDIKVVERRGYSGGSGSSSGGGSSGSSGNNPLCTPTKTCSDYQMQCGINYNNGCSNSLDCSNNCFQGYDCISSSCILADPDVPVFTNLMDNSGINDTFSAIFNVSIKNTNQTVFLRINNQNYQATNLINSIYNLSLYLPAGDYNYYWYSYGNGSRMVYNLSSIKTFRVNGPVIYISNCGFYNYPTLTTLKLSNNLSSPMSCLFLSGKINLDLNGYSIKYLDAQYNRIPNYNFEEWSGNIPSNWDTSNAPGLRKVSTNSEMPLIGNYAIFIPAGQSITSDWIYLPIVNRTYRGITVERGTGDWGQVTRIEVLDSNNNVICTRNFAGKMGGGTGFCNFKIQNPGNYRLRITPTQRGSYYDYSDILPALDTGVTSVRYYTDAWCVDDSGSCNSPDYLGKYPNVAIPTEISISNGSIESVSEGFRTTNILIEDLYIHGISFNMDNVKITNKGIGSKTMTMSLSGTIKNSKFYNHMPWVINREDTGEVSINLGGNTLFNNNTVIGGQGLLSPSGNNIISNNYFRNNQTVTNHYSINSYGRRSNITIFNNIIEPESGSGILMSSGSRDWKVYNNFFNITAAKCDPEYLSGDIFTTNAIRITDYDSSRGGSGVSNESHIYDNIFYINGKYYPNFPNCQTGANGIFYSIGGGDNYIENNRFFVENKNKSSMAYAFYIGGSHNGGIWKNNYIKSNDAAVWIASYYGPAANSRIENNTFERINDGIITGRRCAIYGGMCCNDYSNFKFGFCCGMHAENISFINNNFVNTNYTQDCYYSNYNDPYDFSYYWYLNIYVTDSTNKIPNAEIKIKSVLNKTSITSTDSNGYQRLSLLDFNQSGSLSSSGTTKYYTTNNPYNITIFKYGYKPYNILININGMKNLDVILEPENNECLINDIDKDGYAPGCLYGNYDCDNNNPNVNPGKEEICNGIDDNCINGIDEVSILGTTSCGIGICAHTSNNCINGQITSCNPFEGKLSEICENNIDEDCDGFDSICDNLIINQNTPDGIAASGGNINLICEASDNRGIKSIELYNNLGGTFSRKDIKYPNSDYIWIEAEDFFPQSGWRLCGKNLSCGDDAPYNRWQINGGASGFKFMLGSNAQNLTLNKYFEAGTYYIYARSFMRSSGSARLWNLSIDSMQFLKSFNNLNTNRYDWEYAGSTTLTSGDHKIDIIENSYDYYFDYPDLILFTKDANFNPGSNCGNNVFNFRNFTDVFNAYSNYNCNKPTTNSLSVSFSLSGIPSGNYIWSCKATNDLGYSKFTNNRTFTS